MTFRGKALIFFIFLLSVGCKSMSYYPTRNNPANVGLIMECPDFYYYNNPSANDSLKFYLINYNSEEIVVPHWFKDMVMVGQPRFYTKEYSTRVEPFDLRMPAMVIQPGDTNLICTKSINKLLDRSETKQDAEMWKSNGKVTSPPHKLGKKKYQPYVYLASEFQIKVPNQQDQIKIRTSKQKVVIKKYEEPFLKHKKCKLTLLSSDTYFDPKKPDDYLTCKVENLGEYPINLFKDPGQVRFKLYAYNPNRTSVMHTEFILDNGKLPLQPVTVNKEQARVIRTIPLDQILFKTAPEQTIYYWVWNKKKPPISPLILGKKSLVPEVEFWFSITIDGKEYLSNTVKLKVIKPKKSRARGKKNS